MLLRIVLKINGIVYYSIIRNKVAGRCGVIMTYETKILKNTVK